MLKRRVRARAESVPASTSSDPASGDRYPQPAAPSDRDAGTNVKVVVRVRPENPGEIRASCSTVVKVLDDNVLVFDPKDDSLPRFERVEAGRFRRPMLTRKRKDLKFAFDRVFDENSSQTEVFENTTKAVLDGILDGINCSVFAYGATGAGKTYTMLGSEEQPGVMFLTMMELYKRIEAIKDDKTCEVAVSYLEVYNEVIHDLLQPTRQLTLREDSQRGVVVSGLSQHQPKSAEELLQMLKAGNKNRMQHPTEANATSSRSHAVFQVFVHQKARTAGLSAEVTTAKMSLIDLAGSERATVTSNRGARLREGANINKSLLALGNCINALASNKGKTVHIPYRNSKLTRLLKDSLGGNCRTVMIANISPSGHSYEDTYNTLKYADRAKQIKAKVVRNVVNVDFHVTRYKVIVTELRKEVDELKQKLLEQETPVGPSFDMTQAARFQGMLQDVYSKRAQLKKQMADLDAAERDILLRTYRKERDVHRIEVLTANDHRLAKVQAKLDFLQQRLSEVHEQKERARADLALNADAVAAIQSELETALGSTTTESATASASLQSHMAVVMEARKLEAEGTHQWKQTKHLLKYIKNQEQDISRTERLFTLSLELIHEQRKLLLASNQLSSPVRGMYDQLVRMTEGDKEVVWADQSSDDAHDITSLGSSQRALFDAIVSNSSPLRRVAASDTRRFSSPATTASLGILTSTSSLPTDPGKPVVQAPSPYLVPAVSHGISCHPLATRLLAQRQAPTSITPSVAPEHLPATRLSTVKELAHKGLSSSGMGPKRHREVTIPPGPTPSFVVKRRREVATPCILLTEETQKRGEKRPRTPDHVHSAPPSPRSPCRNSPPNQCLPVERRLRVPPTSIFLSQPQQLAGTDSTDGSVRHIHTPKGRLNLSELTSISSPFYPSVNMAAAVAPVGLGFEDNFVSPCRPPISEQGSFSACVPSIQRPSSAPVPAPRTRPGSGSASGAPSRPIPSPAVISLGATTGSGCNKTTVASMDGNPATAFKRVTPPRPPPRRPVAMAIGSTSPVPMETTRGTATAVVSSAHLFVPVVSPAIPSSAQPPPSSLVSAFPPVSRCPLDVSNPARQSAFSRPAPQSKSRQVPLLPPKPTAVTLGPDTQQEDSTNHPASSAPLSEDQLNTTFTVSASSPSFDETWTEESSSDLRDAGSRLASDPVQEPRGRTGAATRPPLPSAFRPLQCSTNKEPPHGRQRAGSAGATAGEISRKVPGYRSLTKSAANKRVQAGQQARITQKENQSLILARNSSGRRHNLTRSVNCKSARSQLSVH